MSDEAGLLDAIVREPDDDLHRLVYADWLEEQGHDARAEFIRVQLERARPDTEESRLKALIRREKALLAQNGRRWAKPFRPRLTRLGYRRGFVERASADAELFLSGPDDLLTCAPILLLALRDARPHVRALIDCAPLSWLEGLSVQGLGEDALTELFASPHLEGLESLDLTRNGLDNQGLSRVLRRLGPSLRVLYLDRNDLEGEGLAPTLLEHAPHLHTLSVVGNELNENDQEQLTTLPMLRTLLTDRPAIRSQQLRLRERHPDITFRFNWQTEWEA